MKLDPRELFAHVYLDHGSTRTMYLLHGTGADQYDLLPLVEPYEPSFNIVSLRGNVNKFGMRRFFALKQPGSFAPDNFDLGSIAEESAKLEQFVQAWRQGHPDQVKQEIFLGYSNGANMILCTTFAYPQLIDRAVLLHPLLPPSPVELDLTAKEFLVTFGATDPLIAPTLTEELIVYLKEKGAEVSVASHPGGHEIRSEELAALSKFVAGSG